MCNGYQWLIKTASVVGAIQSLLWIVSGVSGALVHLCVLSVRPYEKSGDFFRVTLVKLYFEGRKCKLDGSYLGAFEEYYEKEMDLLPKEMVFCVIIAYVILNAIFFVLSVIFYGSRKVQDKRNIALGWSCMCLVICAADVLISYALVLDVISLWDYTSTAPENTVPEQKAELPYIPLALALLASRFIAGWLWNFIIGFIIFMDALCCRNIIAKPPKRLPSQQPFPKKVREVHSGQSEIVKRISEQPRKDTDEEKPADFRRYFLPSGEDYQEYRKSMEATTPFNIPEKPTPAKEHQGWSNPPAKTYWRPRPRQKQTWDADNEGFVSDDDHVQRDFDHDLKNFEPGQRKIKVVKPPVGRPVNIPVPPPLPPSGSCNC